MGRGSVCERDGFRWCGEERDGFGWGDGHNKMGRGRETNLGV